MALCGRRSFQRVLDWICFSTFLTRLIKRSISDRDPTESIWWKLSKIRGGGSPNQRESLEINKNRCFSKVCFKKTIEIIHFLWFPIGNQWKSMFSEGLLWENNRDRWFRVFFPISGGVFSWGFRFRMTPKTWFSAPAAPKNAFLSTWKNDQKSLFYTME